jgi:hypothetical protein
LKLLLLRKLDGETYWALILAWLVMDLFESSEQLTGATSLNTI